MTKRKKKKIIYSAILLALGIIIVLISLFFVKYKTVDNYMTARAYHYLSAKYDADESEFILIDYDKAHWFLNDDDFPELEYSNYKWEFEYNGREFFVNMDGKEFYDDYQLEDVEKWCVCWLQKNVDKSIWFIGIDSEDLYSYLDVAGKNYIVPDDAYSFLCNLNASQQTFISSNIKIYCYNKNVNDEAEDELITNIIKKLNDILDTDNSVSVSFSQGNMFSYLCKNTITKKWYTEIRIDY